MSSTPWVVAKSEHALKQNIDSYSKQKLYDNINSKNFLSRRLKFVKPKKECNSRALSAASSSSSTPPRPGRQRSDFNAPSRQLYPESKITPLMKWKSCVDDVGSGLRNLGNSCFMNATLQCLCYTPPFQNYIATKTHTKLCKTSGYCVFCELQKLMPTMLYSNHTTVPSTVFRNLRLLSRTLRPGRQEDAQEFLRYLMDGLQNATLKQQGRKIKDMRIQETTAIHKIWGGYLRSQIKCCKCGYESNTYDAILDVSLEIKGPSVRTAFKHFTDPEILDDDNKYKCSNCNKLRRAIKQFTIFEPPNVLVVHLKRFESGGCGGLFSGGKINKHVRFDEQLDLTDFMSYQICPKVSYSLFGVLVHYGYSSHGGHYVSYIKAADNNWYLMDDSRCEGPVRMNTVLKEKAYLLFYIRNETKVLYQSPSSSPLIKTNKINTTKPSYNHNQSISSFDSLQELANVLPKQSYLFDKRINTESPTLTGSKRTLSTKRISNEPEKKRSRPSSEDNTPKLKPSNSRSKKRISPISHINYSSTSSSDSDISRKRVSKKKKYSDDPSLEWQKSDNGNGNGNGNGIQLCGEKRKSPVDISNSPCSPAKKRKISNGDGIAINCQQLKLLKQRLKQKKALENSSKSTTPSSSSSSSCSSRASSHLMYINDFRSKNANKFIGRKSNTLRLAAKNRLQLSSRSRRLSKHSWYNKKHPTLSDTSSDSLLSENNSNHKKISTQTDESSCSISLSPSSPPSTTTSTTLPNNDTTSPRTLPCKIPTKTMFPSLSSSSSDKMLNKSYNVDDIHKFLNNKSSEMSAIGIGGISSWSNINDNNLRKSIIKQSQQPLVAPKDEWDLALDSAYQQKTKQKKDEWKNYDHNSHKNYFQVFNNHNNDPLSSINNKLSSKKRKKHQHERNKLKHQRRLFQREQMEA